MSVYIIPTEKRCPVCKIIHPIDFFGFHKRSFDGQRVPNGYCKECQTLKAKERHAKKKEAINQFRRDNRELFSERDRLYKEKKERLKAERKQAIFDKNKANFEQYKEQSGIYSGPISNGFFLAVEHWNEILAANMDMVDKIHGYRGVNRELFIERDRFYKPKKLKRKAGLPPPERKTKAGLQTDRKNAWENQKEQAGIYSGPISNGFFLAVEHWNEILAANMDMVDKIHGYRGVN